jgi:hypothetical protein
MLTEMHTSAQPLPSQALYRTNCEVEEKCSHFDISSLVESRLFAFATCVSCLEHQDVETADVRYEVTRQQAADRFLSSATPRASLLSAQYPSFSGQDLGFKGLAAGGAVVASGPCCDRFGGFPARSLRCVTPSSRNCTSVQGESSKFEVYIITRSGTPVPSLAVTKGNDGPDETFESSGVSVAGLSSSRDTLYPVGQGEAIRSFRAKMPLSIWEYNDNSPHGYVGGL